MEAGLLTNDQIKTIDKEVKKHIEEETEKALSSRDLVFQNLLILFDIHFLKVAQNCQ